MELTAEDLVELADALSCRGEDPYPLGRVFIARRTEKAVYVAFDADNQVWLPLSQTLTDHGTLKVGAIVPLVVTSWLGRVKGLPMHKEDTPY